MELQTTDPWMPCHSCKTALAVLPNKLFSAYFENRRIACSACKAEIDLWDSTASAVKANFMLNGALDLVDAKTTRICVTMEPDKEYVINFNHSGVPKDATIYDINYSPQGIGVTPLEMHGSTPQRHKAPRIIRVYARPFSVSEQGPRPTDVIVSAKWVPHAGSNIALQYLIDAFTYFCQKDYKSMTLSAHLAIEQNLSEVIKAFMKSVVPSEKPLIPDYARQLKFLLPFLVRLQGFKELDEKIVRLLDQLRDARNKCSHPGEPDYLIDHEQASLFLTAALFGYHYLQRIGPALLRSWSHRRTAHDPIRGHPTA